MRAYTGLLIVLFSLLGFAVALVLLNRPETAEFTGIVTLQGIYAQTDPPASPSATSIPFPTITISPPQLPSTAPTPSLTPITGPPATPSATPVPAVSQAPDPRAEPVSENDDSVGSPEPSPTPTPGDTATGSAVLAIDSLRPIRNPFAPLLDEIPQPYYGDNTLSRNGLLRLITVSSGIIAVGAAIMAMHHAFGGTGIFGIASVFGMLLLFTGVGTAVTGLYLSSPASGTTRTFSPYTMFVSSWRGYKSRFITPEGRVIDHGQGDVTTSEGQSYAMLQAVWVDDKETFDRVWSWTRNNLSRPSDRLFGWRYGRLAGGSYGFTSEGGDNSASDASSDIALALILASRRWNAPSYSEPARLILADMWEKETTTAGNIRYLTAGNWASDGNTAIINPSYFSPYAWRIFAREDPARDWESLIAPAYELLAVAGSDPLNTSSSVGLPPDWIAIDRTSGEIRAPDVPGLKTDYSFDAMRIPWRVAVDYLWNEDPAARAYLESLVHLSDEYQKQNRLPGGFTHDGRPTTELEQPVQYATSIGYFSVIRPEIAREIYDSKIIGLYSNDANSFKSDLPYYESNWLWFGSALYHDRLIPFSEQRL